MTNFKDDLVIDQAALTRRLRLLRLDQGWTIYELGTKARIDPTHVSHLEAGRRQLTLDVASRYARAFGCTIDEVIGFNHNDGK